MGSNPVLLVVLFMGKNNINSSFLKSFNIFLIFKAIYLFIFRLLIIFINRVFKDFKNNEKTLLLKKIKSQNSIISIVGLGNVFFFLDYLYLKLSYFTHKNNLITKFIINLRLNQIS